MKKSMIIVWIALFLVFLALTYNYVRTGKAIGHFYEDSMRLEDLSELGFISPYINHYNRGITYYTSKDYLNAEKEFRKALKATHPSDEERDCKIRINLALSMVKPLTPDSITLDNVDYAIKILEEARSILCERGCADMEDKEWHSDDAQTLKKEIDAYIEMLKNFRDNPPPPQNDDSNGNGEGGGGNGGGDDSQNGGGGGDDDQNGGGDNGGQDDDQNGQGNQNNNGGGDDQNGGGDQDQNNGGGDDDQNGGGGGQSNDPYQDMLDELQGLQGDSTQDRQHSQDFENNSDYSYYSGKPW